MQLALRRIRTSSRPDAGPHLPALPVQCRVRKPPGSNVWAFCHSMPCIQSHTEASYIAMCCWPLCVPPMPFLCRILHFHPSPKFTPPVCHRLLPLPFGPLRVWIRSLRLSSLSIFVIWKIRESVCSFIVLTMKCLFLLTFSFGVSCSCCLRVMSPRRSSFAPSSSTSALIYASILSSTIRMLSPDDSTLSM